MTQEAHEKSKAVWNQMAPGWDKYRDYMWSTTRHVAEWLVDAVEPQEGDVILDVAGGPGDLGFLAAERVAPSGRLIETDFAPQMVDVARRRADQLGLTNVEHRVLDAEQMDLGDDSVDGVLCRWGFMLMIDPQSALRQCRRVLKDGGRLAFSVWGAAEKNPWVTVPGMTMVQMGHVPGGDPFAPGGMFSLANHDTIRELVGSAGFSDIRIEEMAVDWSFSSFDDAWAFSTEVAGAIAALVQQLPPDEVAAFRTALERNEEPYKTAGGGVSTPGVTINVVAS